MLLGELGAQLQALADELRRPVVLHADETPVTVLQPGNGETHRVYIRSYCTASSTLRKGEVSDTSETCMSPTLTSRTCLSGCPTHPANRIDEPLSHSWSPSA